MIKKIKSKWDDVQSDPLVRQSFITLLLRVFGVVTLFGFTFFLTRNFPAEIVGQYDFSRAFLLLLGSVALLGTEQSILLFTGKLKAENSYGYIKKIYFENLKILFLSSFIILFIFLLIPKESINNFFNDPSAYYLVKTCVFVLLFYAITLYNTEFLRALNDVYFSELFRNTFKFFPVFVGAVFLFFNQKYIYLLSYFFIYGFILLSIITTLMIITKLKKIDSLKTPMILFSKKDIIKHSYSMGISSIIFFLILSIDIFLLKKYFGNSYVAYYSTAIKIMTFMTMVILSISINISPKMAELYQLNKKSELIQIINKSNKIIFIINLIFGLFLLFFGKFVLSLFGENYHLAYHSLIILVLTQIVCSYFGVIQTYMNMTNKGNVLKKLLLISLSLNILFNVLLIPKYGMIGAAASFSISTLFWTFASVLTVWIKDKILIFKMY